MIPRPKIWIMTYLDHLLQLKSLLLHVCPPATCAGAVRAAWSSYSRRSASQPVLESSQREEGRMKRCQLLSAADPTCNHKLGCPHCIRSKGGWEHTASANEHINLFPNRASVLKTLRAAIYILNLSCKMSAVTYNIQLVESRSIWPP